MENFEFIYSERGKERTLLNNFKYSSVRQSRDGLMKWKCSNKVCNGGTLTKIDTFFQGLKKPRVYYYCNIKIECDDSQWRCSNATITV